MSTVATSWSYDTRYSDNAAENYQRYFVPLIPAPFGADLVEEAQLQPGMRVLDVACGTGIVTRLAAERVGPIGSVAGVDVNAGMLGVARSLRAELPIKLYESAAQAMPLPDQSFDVVFCQLGLQFIADRAAALREMRRVLVPGGRIYINTAMPNAFFDVLDREIARHVSEEASVFVHAVFSLHEPRELCDLLAEAGFQNVNVRLQRKQLRLPAARDFMWHYLHSTPLLPLLAQTGEAQAAALEQAVVAGWQPWVKDAGLSCEQAVLVASGQAG